jgi:hypothetical protein
MRSRVRSIAILASIATAATAARAQSVPVDSGRFILEQDGQRVGSETFRIARTPAGVLQLVVESVQGGRTATLKLFADASGPTEYEYKLHENGAQAVLIEGVRDGNRFRLRTRRGGNEAMNELLVVPGMLLLDDELISTYALLALTAKGGDRSVTTVAARSWTQSANMMRAQGPDGAAGAVRFVLSKTGDAADATRRELWVTGDKLVKIAIPSRKFVASRETPPR